MTYRIESFESLLSNPSALQECVPKKLRPVLAAMIAANLDAAGFQAVASLASVLALARRADEALCALSDKPAALSGTGTVTEAQHSLAKAIAIADAELDRATGARDVIAALNAFAGSEVDLFDALLKDPDLQILPMSVDVVFDTIPNDTKIAAIIDLTRRHVLPRLEDGRLRLAELNRAAGHLLPRRNFEFTFRHGCLECVLVIAREPDGQYQVGVMTDSQW